VWAETVVSDEVLTGCIRNLRQALRDDSRRPRYIETVHRRGYRFIASLFPNPQAGKVFVKTGREIARTAVWRGVPGNVASQKCELNLAGGIAPAPEDSRLLVAETSSRAPSCARPEPTAGRSSIAVLPPSIEDDKRAHEFFGEEDAEDVIGLLAAQREVFVLSRTSSWRGISQIADLGGHGRGATDDGAVDA
jgi:hypothetical protein